MKISETAAHFNLTALAGALASAELVETVDTTPSLTVFAPTNAAFEAVPNADQLTKEQLTGVLTYHVVSGPPMYDFGTEGGEMTTLQGGKIVVSKKGDDWYANDAKIMGGTEGGVVVGNGVVYVIEG